MIRQHNTTCSLIATCYCRWRFSAAQHNLFFDRHLLLQVAILIASSHRHPKRSRTGEPRVPIASHEKPPNPQAAHLTRTLQGHQEQFLPAELAYLIFTLAAASYSKSPKTFAEHFSFSINY